MRFIALLSLAALTVLSTACAAPQEEDEASSGTGDALTLASNDFESTLAAIDAATARCEDQQGCNKADDAEGAEGGIGTRSIPLQPLARPTLRGARLCNVLRPLAALQSPYFFAGLSGNVTGIRRLLDGGVDIVFDLRNQQAALFHYHGTGYSNLVGIEANAYSGYAFGRKANVLEAWSGDFQSADATVEVPFLNIGVGGKIFRAPDNSLFGGAAVATIGLNALGPYGAIEVSVDEGHWTAWDGATRAYGKSLWFSGFQERNARVHGKSHTYIQFNGAKDVGIALVQSFGRLGTNPAAVTAALASIKSAGLSIDQACPR
jgi:hypothetical protein